ncbi:endo 1,5-alpha-arabinase [Aspergillus clavatus NRRL 1]|uniref:Arabinan endo-1,5-alpha-L-arabinosidase n=1 Tax=Aspergillus clavatus (strain ATCC 1007 / CBS 513.65 / DSM 816 / NCTC 3887 / NRRL 1 / QM 1276 / 107) TaxID=344612 RepID=A1CK29_ASPCL|nr:endo 1,5-alpha-arabinase [Aspergillus clavatus NRRL 1]EAW09503.1 endo 1,5-alpha-arabinase [Aspergillus clavatus NRRL 1]
MVRIRRLAQVSLLLFHQTVAGTPSLTSEEQASIFSKTDDYPLPNQGHVVAHDPNIIEYHDHFYLFKGGVHIPVLRSPSLDGPWTNIGTVLDGPSVVEKQNRTRPWAPTTIFHNATFYCYYAISSPGSRNSAIAVATTDALDGGNWTDHGALVNTDKGHSAHLYPYNESNAIDASFIVDNRTGQPYLNYGSYWHGIFQVPLADDLLSVKDAEKPQASNLVYVPDETVKPVEGSWMSFKDPYYYLWFSHGRCCGFGDGQEAKDFPKKGQEYDIRVGRSTSVTGPFQDKDGKLLTNGGGTIVYASNHGVVYAPGGLGVLPENEKHPDILYYHYLNTSAGVSDGDAHLGWNYLKYKDGWPSAQGGKNSGMALRPNAILRISVLISTLFPASIDLNIANSRQ